MTPKLAICYRSYHKEPQISHGGLGICAQNTSKTLIQFGIDATVWPLSNAEELDLKLSANPDVTHVVIQAPWIPSPILLGISQKYPKTQFAVNCHSNVGFLQTEPEAVTKMIDLLDLNQSTHNIQCAGNCEDFTNWITNAYQAPATLLPNLYYLNDVSHTHRPLWNGGTFRIGIFGAPRPQKNVMTGVAAAVELAQMLKTKTEIWFNEGRDETHGKTILAACRKAIERNPFCEYRGFSWAAWPAFRRHIGSMNLLIQASYTESFNQVTADGIAVGVPTVVGPAIRWVPNDWKADPDSAHSIACVGHGLVHNPFTQRDGLKALHRHNDWGLMHWKRFLGIPC